ncbi:MAG: hypothetical protein QW134_05005 [Nitrososphaeria archaeon]
MESPEIQAENEMKISPETVKEIKEKRETERLLEIRNAVKALKNVIVNEKIFEDFANLLNTDLLNDNRAEMLIIPTLILNANSEIVYDLKEISKVILNTKHFPKRQMALKIIEIQNNIMLIKAYYNFICETYISLNYQSCIKIKTYNENSVYELFFYLKLLTGSLIKLLLNI